MKILVTGGPTWVPIDAVRVISNQSSGAMGHTIAETFSNNGHQVTLIEGPVRRILENPEIAIIKYEFYDELASVLKRECAKNYDAIIHAAAVSDFKPEKMVKNKIPSQKRFDLRLIPTKKLIQAIKDWAPRSFLVGFKLLPKLSLKSAIEAAKRLSAESRCDLVVANTLEKGYQAFVITPQGEILCRAKSRVSVADHLLKICTGGRP